MIVIRGTCLQVGVFLACIFLLTDCMTRGPESKVPTVSFCDLIRDPARFDNKTVRTRAIFFRNLENEDLNDPTCGIEDTYVWVEFDPGYVSADDELKKEFDRTLCPSQPCPTGRAKVTVVGRFDGPSGGPYGHLGGYRFRFLLMRLESAEPADPLMNKR